ncbi:DUF3488 domain-containing protein [Leucothrix sargassi]|nr:DUF3488 domain-containing protein [Leucothrix sargassi]
MIWLLAAQLVVMLPFVFFLPPWLIPVMLVATFWRIRVIKGHAAQPKLLLNLFILTLGILGVWASGMRLLSLDAMVSFLLLGFAFKSLEVIRQRDALVVVFIGYFLVAVGFLFSQTILAGAYGVIALIILTAALIANQQSSAQQLSQNATRSNLSLSALMLLQCLPLMVLVFVFMPRFSPLWVIPSFESQAKTGVTDQVTPGDIANLAKSDELAFRVSFKGELPPANERYWRGLVLNNFDGKSWQQLEHQYEGFELGMYYRQHMPWSQSSLSDRGEPLEYDVIYEKTGQPWLFTLTPSVTSDDQAVQLGDYRVMAKHDVVTPFLLNAKAYPDAKRDLNLNEHTRRLALRLPHKGDEQTRAAAKQWRAEATSDEDYVNKVMKRFTEQAYFYTLKPPLLGNSNTIDKFLFESQRGFCVHYAGSFVYLMRAAGIPARMVVGYQGGEWNEEGKYLSVRQYDAHAWTEVWLKGQGWKRYDPTAMVAPSRVEGGLEEALAHEGTFLEGQLFSLQKFEWMDGIRKKMDSIQYGWRRWVLGYDGDTQANLLQTILNKMSSIPLAALVGALFIGIFLFWFVMLGLLKRQRYEAYEHQLYRTFCKRLAKHGIIREQQQTPSEFAVIASSQWPEKSDTIRSFSLMYQQICYVDSTDQGHDQLFKKMRQLLSELR